MWLFLSGGMLMPALIPQSVLDRADTPELEQARENGWDLQIRGRDIQHLRWFTRYMPDGGYSRLIRSPDKDYQCRFYTSRENFAEAMSKACLDMDYVKFKDTSLRYEWGKKYHDLLLSVWSASARVFGAGGFYGPRSKKNPNGYSKRRSLEPSPLELEEFEGTKKISDMTDQEFDFWSREQ